MNASTFKQQQKVIIAKVNDDARPNKYYFVMVVLSCTVATYGLLSNSTAVVIGAMLIAPLMGPILGGALAITLGDNEALKTAGRAEAAGSVLAVTLATILTLILPSAEITPEVLARTSPTILDLVIALASGAAGTYAICVKPQGATLPGVAIATALMPPLCVVGIGLAKQDFVVVIGALLLFIANMIAINVAAIAMFEFVGFFKGYGEASSESNGNDGKANNRLIYPVILLIVVSIPLAFIMYKTYVKAHTEKIVRATLNEALQVISPHSTLISIDFKEQEAGFTVGAAFRGTKVIAPENIRQMENILELRLGKPVAVNADVVLVQKVDNKTSVDTYRELLPKIKEKEIVEVVRSSTPEDVIEHIITEKIALLPEAKLEDYSLEYRKGSGTYVVNVRLLSTVKPEEKLGQSIKSVLEERLKRRVIVNLESREMLSQ